MCDRKFISFLWRSKMFREIRRKKQQLANTEAIRILEKGSYGVLAVMGDDDYPYACPLSYLYHEGKIYFHCATQGHKLDAIRRNCKASFCVVGQDHVMPHVYTTYYKSVIMFGKIRILEENTQKRAAIEKLAKKYFPQDTQDHRNKTIEKEFPALCMLEMSIDHISGKQARELAE